MSRAIHVYVAGPLTGDAPENARQASLAGQVIADAGMVEFVPHDSVFRHQATPRSWEAWVAWCCSWVERCDVLLRLPGKSEGADAEVAHALAHGIPVVHALPECMSQCVAAARNVVEFRRALHAGEEKPPAARRDTLPSREDRDPPPVPEAWTERDGEPDRGQRVQAKVVGEALREIEQLAARMKRAEAESEQLAEQLGSALADLETQGARITELEDEPADLAARLRALEQQAEREREAGAAAQLARLKLLEHGHKAMAEQLKRLQLRVCPRG